ncbi:MAG: mandelate racemase/muconate lactonizing enzyme family protein [Nannocystaceae bacterium]
MTALRLRRVDLSPDPAPTADGLILRVEGDDGRVGRGEAVARVGFSPPYATLVAGGRGLAQRLVGARLSDVDAIAALSAALGEAGVASPLRFAVDSALLDLLGQAGGCSAASLLGAPAAAIERNALLGPAVGAARAGGLHLPAALADLRARGFATVKVKARGPWPEEQVRLRPLGRPGIPRPALRVDCNGSIPPELAPAMVAALGELAPEYVEEPVAGLSAAAWAELAALPGAPRLAVDESALTEPAWREHLEVGAARVAVIKPAFVGGLFVARRRAHEAWARGVEVVITSALDGAVGVAAAAQLALALAGDGRGRALAAGLNARPEAPRPGGLAADRPTIELPRRPGLGLDEVAAGGGA